MYNNLKLRGIEESALTVKLEVTEEEAEYLDDMLSIWIDGYDDAERLTHEDRSIDDLEDYMRAVGGITEQKVMATEIRYKLREMMIDGREGASTV